LPANKGIETCIFCQPLKDGVIVIPIPAVISSPEFGQRRADPNLGMMGVRLLENGVANEHWFRGQKVAPIAIAFHDGPNCSAFCARPFSDCAQPI
jgi:hypothetical protein